MNKKILAVLCAGSIGVAGVARADSLTAANAAFDQKDYGTAFRLYEPLAERGDHAAQSALGFMYFFGEGVRKDAVRAYAMFSLAAQGAGGIANVAETNRKVVRRTMTPAEISLAETTVRRCLAANPPPARVTPPIEFLV